jgi:hypothetical protein
MKGGFEYGDTPTQGPGRAFMRRGNTYVTGGSISKRHGRGDMMTGKRREDSEGPVIGVIGTKGGVKKNSLTHRY